jgi:hypothetical protein
MIAMEMRYEYQLDLADHGSYSITVSWVQLEVSILPTIDKHPKIIDLDHETLNVLDLIRNSSRIAKKWQGNPAHLSLFRNSGNNFLDLLFVLR